MRLWLYGYGGGDRAAGVEKGELVSGGEAEFRTTLESAGDLVAFGVCNVRDTANGDFFSGLNPDLIVYKHAVRVGIDLSCLGI